MSDGKTATQCSEQGEERPLMAAGNRKRCRNILHCHFSAAKAHEKWLTDVTVFSSQARKLNFSPIPERPARK
ncbi:hypothetical protein EB241_15040 [Erwinia psidii]|uniref:Uncharacterized protein n=1 Tax=Erwinia psidii TaxID=69224 RepID=A0A3N6TQM4_9GAMM|nr:hypothetical protein EB241_15040 [Erwinia psidii]